MIIGMMSKVTSVKFVTDLIDYTAKNSVNFLLLPLRNKVEDVSSIFYALRTFGKVKLIQLYRTTQGIVQILGLVTNKKY